MREQLGDQLQVNWRYFPLEQVNSAEGPEWKLWEQPDSHRSRGRVAFQAAIAARNQGDEAFERFHWGLLKAKHEDGQDHGKASTLRAVAEEAGLDLEQFERDRTDRSMLSKIGEDYAEGHDRLGAFGTPTFIFPNEAAAYLKLTPKSPLSDPMAFFEEFIRIGRDRTDVLEIKRPNRPSTG